MRRNARLLLLVAAMAGLLVYAWASDRPSPSHPEGVFGAILIAAVLTLSPAAIAALLFRRK